MGEERSAPHVSRSDVAQPARPLAFTLVTALFFLSGSAGLAYQVLWMRTLGLFFGSDIYGVSIILSSFMGGLALGSLLGGRLAERTPRPLLWYGIVELGIGIFALGFPHLIAGFEPLLEPLYPQDAQAAPWPYHVLRVLFAGAALLVPTSFMGATLPLIMKHFVRSRGVLGRFAAHFYAVNTLGALFGTLAAGFVLLPYLGMTASTFCAVGINLAVGAACALIGLRARLPVRTESLAPREADALPGIPPEARRRIARAALIGIAVSGFASFALEVAWTRILVISFSATVYSFSAMLACFLFGIFLGSRFVSSFVDRHPNPIGLFAALELGVGVSVGVMCLLVHVVPGFFGRLMSGVATLLGEAREHTLVVSTLVASFALLFVPTILLGATFAVALRAYTTNVSRVGRRTGNLYAANTFGAILGSLAAGLVMIPTFGTAASLALIALLFTCVGIYLAAAQAPGLSAALAPSRVATAAAVTIVLGGVSLLMPYRVTLNFNQRADVDSELVYHAEGVQNTIDVIRSPSGITALVIGGNVEADDSDQQRRHFVLKGHLPLMLIEDPKTVLVIGLGMGITLQATARHAGLERIDVVELSPEIVDAQAQLADVNGDVLANPIVRARIDDGRMYMKLTRNRYDMITADPIHPKISRVGYLYTREYYESIRDRLNPGGVVCQWMPVYQIAPSRLRSAIKTFLEVFPEATLWYVQNHALLVAKPDAPAIDYRLLERKFQVPRIREDFASIGIHSPEELLGHLILGPRELRAFVEERKAPLNTDDFPYLEYFVPGDLFHGTRDNVRELLEHLADPTRYVKNLPDAAATEIRARARAVRAREKPTKQSAAHAEQ
jgi:spermidine synthase